MQHVEFFHKDHFEFNYHRKKAKKSLASFIDFFWETKFDDLLQEHPQGFSDALFPNVGYTYIINLGTPVVMQLEEEFYDIRSDGFLPRHKNMICHHTAGNKLFGIKFNVSPVVFEKRINFFEYRDFIFPLAYLIDRKILERIKTADSFTKRIEIVSAYYERIVEQHAGSLKYVDIVTKILKNCTEQNNFSPSIEALSEQHGISSRTLQRYFEAATSISSKQALQIMRIRKAVDHLVNDATSFRFQTYGYYDYSHFYKHLKAFINQHTAALVQPHVQLLKGSFSK